ncbi:MAG: methyltransferase domain-containing protein [Ignavibacteria bacterium]|nr:methyltransferase domain-containing protein [Ignavibacteria bacterium]
MWSDKQKEFYNEDFTTLASKSMEVNIRRKYVDFLVKILNENGLKQGGKKFLEIGCNEGIIMEMMQKNYPDSKFSGFDISDKHVEIAAKKGLNVFVGDAEKMNPEDKYDVIYGTAVLHHLNKMDKFLIDLRNYLNEDGILLFGPEPVHNNFVYIIWHSMRGFWNVEKGMLQMKKREIRKMLKENYSFSKIFTKGNAFAYAFKLTGAIWDFTRLSRLPIINDMYIIAKK